MATKSELYICRESFVGELPGGIHYRGVKGVSILDPSHTDEAKLLKVWGEYFEPIKSTFARPTPEVEQATAAPGEKRGE
jgi:hypothetical protein